MKVVLVTGMLPSGHYSQYVAKGLMGHDGVEVIIYTDRNKENLKITGCGKIINLWSKSPRYILDIIFQLRRDRPDIVHLQHELNMFGGGGTAVLFPLLVVAIKLMGIPVVTTIHSAVEKRIVGHEFSRLFFLNPIIFTPLIMRLLFTYIYNLTSRYSSSVIVHTKLTLEALVVDYGVSRGKIFVIPAAIPERSFPATEVQPYFFYFGYMARRKGLSYLLNGFKKFSDNSAFSHFRLILAGGVIKGQELARDEVQQLVVNLGLSDKVSIKGFVDENEQDRLYANAFAVVIPAEVSMGSSGPLYHASSYGKAVLCSKVGHFLEDIEDGKTGILVVNDRWGEALLYAAEHPEVISKIESAVQEKARMRTPYKTTARYIDIYKNNITGIFQC